MATVASWMRALRISGAAHVVGLVADLVERGGDVVPDTVGCVACTVGHGPQTVRGFFAVGRGRWGWSR